MAPSRSERNRAEVADVARLMVRAGYRDPAGVRREVTAVVRAELDDREPERVADELVARAERELAEERQSWLTPTDNDRLAEVFGELRGRGVLVLEHCQDHFDATAELKAHPGAGGILFFTETDVWHAVTDRMLELKVWHADTSNVVSADPELALVLDALHRHGLPALFDEGRIEVTLTWRRRPLG